MKINANKHEKVNQLILATAIIALLVNFVLSFFQGSFTDEWYLSAAGGALILYLIYRGPSEFRYDSEGEVLNFTTNDNIWAKLFRDFKKHYEFPKRRLHGYKLKRGFFRRRLVIYIKSRSGGIKERSLLISYLSKAQTRTLVNSLRKYSQKNKDGRRKSESGT